MTDNTKTDMVGAAAMRESFDAVLASLLSSSSGSKYYTGEPLDGDAQSEDASTEAASQAATDGAGSDGFKTPAEKRAAIPKPLIKRANLDTNDLGMATRWEYYSAGKALYCSAIGWMAFDGLRFQAEDGGALARQNLLRMIEKIKFEEYPALRAMAPSAAEVTTKVATQGERDQALALSTRLRKAAITLGNNNKTQAVMAQAAARPKFLVKFDEMDAHPGRLNTPKGVIELPLEQPKDLDPETLDDRIIDARAALSLSETSVKDKMTRVASFSPPLKAPLKGVDPHPVWTAHLKKIQPDAEDRKTLQRVLGSCLVTKNDQNHWFVFQGRGGDGKSVTLHIIRHILNDYVRSADVKSFLHDSRANASGPREDLMRLSGGTRMVIVAEPEVGAQLSTSTIKLMTGGEEISTRGGHKTQIEFEPQFKLIMMCNEPPKVKGDDEGTWRRPIMIRFPVRIPKNEIDPNIKEKLEAEAPQIFAWLVEGYLDWWARGFDYAVSDNVTRSTRNWRRESSQFAAWFEDRIVCGHWFDDDRAQKEEPALWRAMQDDKHVNYEDAVSRLQGMYLSDKAPPKYYSPAEIYDDYCAWAAANSLEPWKKGTFSHKWWPKLRDMTGEYARRKVQGYFQYSQFDFVDGKPRVANSSSNDPYENYPYENYAP